jgi:NTP pyrophosphatase (non-canonical NTP hydrolase)
MTIRELTGQIHAVVRAKGWLEGENAPNASPRNLAVSVAVEAAEVLEHFQWGETYDRTALTGELADVAIYLFQLADLTGVDLSQAIQDKMAVNMTRTWTRPE